MYEENSDHISYKGQNHLTTERKFGTELAKHTANRRHLYSIAHKTPVISEDTFSETYKILHNIECDFLAEYGYMCNQEDINEQMRGILIDWLVTIQYKFNFSPETLFLTVNLLDRYLEKALISRKELQLVGICAMFIACKYEETIIPEIKDLVYISANAYTKNDIIDMELKILKMLNFNITIASSLKFLERYSKLLNFKQNEYYLARYFIELSLIDYQFLKYKPSIIAASAIYLVEKYKGKEISSDINEMPYYYNEIRDCVIEFISLIDKAHTSSLQGIREKFLEKAYISAIKISLVNNVFY